jgi:hypothetical protein
MALGASIFVLPTAASGLQSWLQQKLGLLRSALFRLAIKSRRQATKPRDSGTLA